MSAPAGWYPTPDGKERFWDGTAWLDQTRDRSAPVEPPAQPSVEQTSTAPTRATFDPVGPDPTAANEPVDRPALEATQQLRTDATGVLPLSDNASGRVTDSAPVGVAVAQPGDSHQPAYGQPGLPTQPGYGQPGAYGPLPVASAGGSGKGCLIAALVTAGVVVVGLIVAVVLFAKFVNNVKDDPTILLPDTVRSSLAMPTPSFDLPTPVDPTAPGGADNPVETTLGSAFTVGPVTVAQGWSLKDTSIGMATFQDIKATSTAGSTEVSAFLDLTFYAGDTEVGSTICTVEHSATPVEVNCLPVESEALKATKIKVTAGY